MANGMLTTTRTAQVTLQRCVATIRHHFAVPPRAGEEATGYQLPHQADGGHEVGSLGPSLCVGLLDDDQVHDVIFVLKCAALNMEPREVCWHPQLSA